MVVKHCCYGNCKNDSRFAGIRPDMEGVKFLPFPKPKSNYSKSVLWLTLCGRRDFDVNRITKDMYICTKHFVGEKGPTVAHPDPIAATITSRRKGAKRKASSGHLSNESDTKYPDTRKIFRDGDSYGDTKNPDTGKIFRDGDSYEDNINSVENSEEEIDHDSTNTAAQVLLTLSEISNTRVLKPEQNNTDDQQQSMVTRHSTTSTETEINMVTRHNTASTQTEINMEDLNCFSDDEIKHLKELIALKKEGGLIYFVKQVAEPKMKN